MIYIDCALKATSHLKSLYNEVIQSKDRQITKLVFNALQFLASTRSLHPYHQIAQVFATGICLTREVKQWTFDKEIKPHLMKIMGLIVFTAANIKRYGFHLNSVKVRAGTSFQTIEIIMWVASALIYHKELLQAGRVFKDRLFHIQSTVPQGDPQPSKNSLTLSSNDAVEKANDNNNARNGEINKLNSRLEEATNKLKIREQDCVESQKKITNLTSLLKNANDNLKSKEKEINQLKSKLKEVEANHKVSNEPFNKSQPSYQEVNTLKEQISQLEDQLQKVRSSITNKDEKLVETTIDFERIEKAYRGIKLLLERAEPLISKKKEKQRQWETIKKEILQTNKSNSETLGGSTASTEDGSIGHFY